MQPSITQKRLVALAPPGALLLAALLFIAISMTHIDLWSLTWQLGLSMLFSGVTP